MISKVLRRVNHDILMSEFPIQVTNENGKLIAGPLEYKPGCRTSAIPNSWGIFVYEVDKVGEKTLIQWVRNNAEVWEVDCGPLRSPYIVLSPYTSSGSKIPSYILSKARSAKELNEIPEEWRMFFAYGATPWHVHLQIKVTDWVIPIRLIARGKYTPLHAYA